jgi:hypothetical protein
MGLEDDAVVVDSDSDSDVDMDDDTVMVGASARVQPTDIGFSDFDDFGGFQAEAAQPSSSPSPGTNAGASRRQPADPQIWNAFSDPTDAGEPCREKNKKQIICERLGLLFIALFHHPKICQFQLESSDPQHHGRW